MQVQQNGTDQNVLTHGKWSKSVVARLGRPRELVSDKFGAEGGGACSIKIPERKSLITTKKL
jgi:hypothetical protein